ncbi:MAG: hypothetical protein F6K09_04990, partial [Merismopedia sp. SIO2A8]|nr:hypothetical protein [Merismopedia sp. SIO2A8]
MPLFLPGFLRLGRQRFSPSHFLQSLRTHEWVMRWRKTGPHSPSDRTSDPLGQCGLEGAEARRERVRGHPGGRPQREAPRQRQRR